MLPERAHGEWMGHERRAVTTEGACKNHVSTRVFEQQKDSYEKPTAAAWFQAPNNKIEPRCRDRVVPVLPKILEKLLELDSSGGLTPVRL